jgi:hypothetical protein
MSVGKESDLVRQGAEGELASECWWRKTALGEEEIYSNSKVSNFRSPRS